MDKLMGMATDAAGYLKGVKFPAKKQDIVEHLKQENAPGYMVTVADKLPDKVYDSVNDVMGEISKKL